jgi:hypothetical protein
MIPILDVTRTAYASLPLPVSLLLVATGTWIVCQWTKIVYNLFFHPLRHIPGPRLAAATYLPEFYYDVIKSGRYTRRIQQMHQQYGLPCPFVPVVSPPSLPLLSRPPAEKTLSWTLVNQCRRDITI